MAAHALLSASSAHRWLKCTPSARFEEQFANETSPYAAEGTHAHKLAEIRLKQALGEKVRLPTGFKESEHYSDAMEEHVAGFVDQVLERIHAHRAHTPDPLTLFEVRLDYSRWVPGGFGTGDVVIISDLGVEVIDLKYGQGVPVQAENNPQTRLYGLGAYDRYKALYDIDTVVMTIIQPRLDACSSETLTVDELLEWARTVVQPAAALATEGKGDFVPGAHCRFCRARFTCRARAEANLELAKYEFAPAPSLSSEEIAAILTRLENDFQSWVKDIQEYALTSALAGERIPGWKVVEGRSVRKYTDEAAIQKTLHEAGYRDDEILKTSLKGIAEMERLLGKARFAKLLGDFVEKPPGKPTLVPDSDKRPEFTPTARAQLDFNQASA